MSKNILNKNIIIYNNLNNNILIFLSISLGWILVPIKKSHNIPLYSIILGFNKLYKFFFKLKGFGYKWKYNLHNEKNLHTIFFKLGFTHRISLVIKNNTKYRLNKKRFILKNRSIKFIRNNLNFLFFLYKSYIYNKKGIYLRGTKFKTKISKKKSKF